MCHETFTVKEFLTFIFGVTTALTVLTILLQDYNLTNEYSSKEEFLTTTASTSNEISTNSTTRTQNETLLITQCCYMIALNV